MAKNQVVRYVITADAKKATEELGRSANATESIDKKMRGLATAAKGFLAGKALGAVRSFVDDSVRAYSDLNESLNAVNVTFGENAEGIQKLGREAARSLGLSNAEFNSAAVSMSAFVEQIAGESGNVVQTMDDLTTRASDFASVMNLDVGEAFEKFRSGLAGESEPLRQFGIDVSAAAVETFAYANNIADAGEKLTEGEKIQARYGLIMEQTVKTAGDFANTSDSLANQTRITNAEIENQKAIVGEVLEVYGEWGNVAKSFLSRALANLAITIQEATGEITEQEAALKKLQIQTGRTMETVEDWIAAAEDVRDNLDQNRGRIDRETGEIIALKTQWAEFREQLEAVEQPETFWAEMLDSSDTFRHTLGLSNEQVEEFETFLKTRFVDTARETGRSFDRMGGAAGKWKDKQTEAVEEAVFSLEDWSESLRRGAEEQEAFTQSVVEDIEEVATGFQELPEKSDVGLQEWIDNMNTRLAEYETWHANLATLTESGLSDFVAEMRAAGFEGSYALVQEAVDSLGADDGLARLANEAAAGGRDIGKQIAYGIALGIDEATPDIIQATEAAVRRAENAAKDEAAIESPSKLFADEVGKPIAEGIARGIEDSSAPGSALGSLIGGMATSSGSGGGFGGVGGVVINFPNYLGSKEEVARMIRDEIAKLGRRNGSSGL